MTKQILGIGMLTALLLSSCTNTMDKKLNIDDFEKVKQEITSNEKYSAMKKKYLIDNLTMQLKFSEFGKTWDLDNSNLPTFREQISEFDADFDSIRKAKLEIRDNNKKLENFVFLKDVNTISIDKYKGYLSMTLDFNNKFDKEILYIILNYKYINKYDTSYFNEKAKVTDQVANVFKTRLKF